MSMRKQVLVALSLCLLAAGNMFAQNDTITGWNFAVDADTSLYAHMGMESNFRWFLGADDDTSSDWRAAQRDITFANGATTFAAVATGWDGGADIKQWSIKFKAENYKDLKIYSKQKSGNSNPGPRDWKIQAKMDADWMDVPGGTVTVANDWTTGAVDGLELPDDFDNPGTQSIKIRWVMTSNLDINGDEVLATGKAQIDDILVTGTLITNGVEEVLYNSFAAVFPNPANEYCTVQTASTIELVRVYNALGAKVMEVNGYSNQVAIPVNELNNGLYLVEIREAGNTTHLEKLIVE